MFERALAINEKVMVKDSSDTAGILSGLANVFYRNGDYDLTPTVTLTILAPIQSPTTLSVTLLLTLTPTPLNLLPQP